MCQPEVKGGKRCKSHQRGSIVSIKTVGMVTAVSGTMVMGVFKDLRNEGKSFANPAEVEVEEFADTEKFKAKYNSDLTEAERKNVIKNWDRSIEEDEPTGATFHAWKNVVGETFRRVRTKLATTGVSLGLAATLAACSTGGATPNDVTPTPQDPSPAPSASDTVDEDYVEGLNSDQVGRTLGEGWAEDPELRDFTILYDNINGVGDRYEFDANNSQTDVNGQYISSRFSRENYEAGANLIEEYGIEKANELLDATYGYVSQASFDSILVWDSTPESRQKFIEDNIQYIHSDWHDEFIEAVNNPPVDAFTGGTARTQAYDYYEGQDVSLYPYSLDRTRSIQSGSILDINNSMFRDVKNSGSYVEGEDYFVSFQNSVWTPVIYNGETAIEFYAGTNHLLLRADPAAGGDLKISGWGMSTSTVVIADSSGSTLLSVS